jgi:hypothetical protein
MIYTSLVVIAMSASAAVSPLSKLVHVHPHTQMDTRISVTLHNKSTIFQDVRIDGRPYEMKAGSTLTVKAPAGTQVIADGPTGLHKRGDVLVELSSAVNQSSIDLK